MSISPVKLGSMCFRLMYVNESPHKDSTNVYACVCVCMRWLVMWTFQSGGSHA